MAVRSAARWYAVMTHLGFVAILIGLLLPELVGGAIVTEQVFSWPGIGKLAVDSIVTADVPLITAALGWAAAAATGAAAPPYPVCLGRS